MALKAGRVGLDPKYVDDNGAPIGMGETIDAYTKDEADAKFATKSNTYTKTAADNKFATQEALSAYVPETQLTANSKEFNFAYDSTSQKYGYKAGSDGAFTPFEEAGVTIMGWVKPAELSIGSIVLDSGIAYDAGGYCIKDGVLYMDMIVHNTSSKSATSISISSSLPAMNKDSGVGSMIICCVRDTVRSNAEKYYSKVNHGAIIGQTSTAETASLTVRLTNSTSSVTLAANTYMHIWGQYEILTT